MGEAGACYSGGNIQGRGNSLVATEASLETEQSCNLSQRPVQTGRIFGNPLQRPSVETKSSQNVADSVHCSPETEKCAS